MTTDRFWRSWEFDTRILSAQRAWLTLVKTIRIGIRDDVYADEYRSDPPLRSGSGCRCSFGLCSAEWRNQIPLSPRAKQTRSSILNICSFYHPFTGNLNEKGRPCGRPDAVGLSHS